MNFIINSCAVLHEKSVSSVAEKFFTLALDLFELLHFHTIPILLLKPLSIFGLLKLRLVGSGSGTVGTFCNEQWQLVVICPSFFNLLKSKNHLNNLHIRRYRRY